MVAANQLTAFVHKHARYLHLGLQFGQGVARVLVVAHGLAKHLALFDISHCPVDGGLRCSHSGDGNLQTFPRQLLHEANKASTFKGFAAQQVVGGHAHVVKEQLRRVLCFQAEFFQAFTLLKTRHPVFDQQQAGPFGPCRGVGLGDHNHQIGMPTVGDEGFAAV